MRAERRGANLAHAPSTTDEQSRVEAENAWLREQLLKGPGA